jgi:plastocyanin
MSQPPAPTPRSPFTSEVRMRVPLPIIIPLGAIAVIAVITIGMSRILLNVPSEVAVVIAIAVSANILIACTVIALRPQEARRTWVELVIVATYPLIVGLVIAQIGIGEGEASGSAPSEPRAGGGNTVSAQNVQFDTETIELTAGEETTLTFVNDDPSSTQHNISIYENENAEGALFEGQVIPGGQEVEYQVPPQEEGEYYFQCDVHPSMNGDVTVG